MYLRIEQKNTKYHRQKLVTIVEGSYNVTKVENNTVFIEKTNQSVEKVSRSRLVLAPKPETNKEAEEILKPIFIDGKQNQASKERRI